MNCAIDEKNLFRSNHKFDGELPRAVNIHSVPIVARKKKNYTKVQIEEIKMIQTKVAKALAGAEKYYLYTDFTSLHSPLLRLASYSHTIERFTVTFTGIRQTANVRIKLKIS